MVAAHGPQPREPGRRPTSTATASTRSSPTSARAGLWLWNAGAWNQLSGVNVDSLAAGDVDADGADEVAADFGAAGLWLNNGGAWTQLSGINVEQVITANVNGPAARRSSAISAPSASGCGAAAPGRSSAG